ncbi:bifunctional [glutamate--ammonia ligase]-adenylyl-L-tyrosine phosphorylase/[glutamate--ammonia-ligase] adenylyltransferase [Lujinxingia litoralis]|uniref:Bifunctional [glutamate--ammonia ligase]-adenylyl-L-tyrosine phosphorylase/[glutamate--ammonia-ligase] adenylyltransferase n=1 Tax=Lujinxingia litoralis TaxID=2211119 RepID=A0A328CD08_9DELT|nr:bifunctional [glutamate--ammonia ligase]-adenylyl-L-tyrosine phosphorylase/[glutamate--ammonia-ligase] adenylyltransferase [Lujinxingia litoralis]RAL24739.1 bifunctional [glutamate--ammonia ligase]-adenylyl-L-tyrosine phosphorylase/[glutamate--ammonia-ligase] adenylyltransferase [Lujinxingia litoralis]
MASEQVDRLWEVVAATGASPADGERDALTRAIAGGALQVETLVRRFSGVPWPASVVEEVLRLVRELVEQGTLLRSSEEVDVALSLGAAGRHPRRTLTRQPELVGWLAAARWRDEPMPREAMADELAAYHDALRAELSGESDDGSARFSALHHALRWFKHRQLLRIFLREIEGASVRHTTTEVADVAEVCLDEAVRAVAEILGAPELAEHFCVFGMGKLGGRELNYSSDIDLIFVASDAVMVGEVSRGQVETLAREVVRAMDTITDEGQVFRVDLRLRPDGSQGPIVQGASATTDYYLSWGRGWERGALLKARPVAGGRALGAQVLGALEPFIFRRYLDFDAIDELRRMKAMIDDQARASRALSRARQHLPGAVGGTPAGKAPQAPVSGLQQRLLAKLGRSAPSSAAPATAGPRGEAARGPAGWDVKVGRGGIREIEFFVQALQLVHCGTRPTLRVRATLETLDRLLYAGLLAGEEHRALADAYDLYRRLEHRVQMAGDRQSHRLPEEPEAFAELAWRMGESPDSLTRRIEECRQAVREIFERLFEQSPKTSRRATVGDAGTEELAALLALEPDDLLSKAGVRALGEAGFVRPRQAAGQLQVLRQKRYGPFSANRAVGSPAQARYLLSAICSAPDPEQALGHLVRFTTAVGDTPGTWRMLRENPHAARLLMHLFGSSAPLAQMLATEPDVFARMVASSTASLERDRAAMERELRARVSALVDPAHKLGRIRRFHQEESLRIALHEVAGVVPSTATFTQLSDLAQVVLTQVEDTLTPEPRGARALCVVAMGKFGGKELGFGSDLDFIFVYDDRGPGAIDHQEATRRARRLVRALSAATEAGGFYEVDLRLRPSGSQGTLVTSFQAWRAYHLEHAALWERQALIKARAIGGTAALRERLEAERQRLAFDRALPEDLAEKIARMRQRMFDSAALAPGVFDVKQSRGGLIDVEFLTQFLQLEAPQVARDRRDTVGALHALAEHPQTTRGLDVESLARDYLWLRRLELRQAIAGAGSTVPRSGPRHAALARQMGHQGRDSVAQFHDELAATRQRIGQAWAQIFARG